MNKSSKLVSQELSLPIVNIYPVCIHKQVCFKFTGQVKIQLFFKIDTNGFSCPLPVAWIMKPLIIHVHNYQQAEIIHFYAC